MPQVDQDIQNAPEVVEYEAMPKAKYKSRVANSKTKAASSGTNYLNIEFEIIEDGPFKGRKVWDNYNLWHAKPEAKARAQADFAVLSRACGKTQRVTMSEELHDSVVLLTLGTKEYKGKLQNTVDAVESVNVPVAAPPTATNTDSPF